MSAGQGCRPLRLAACSWPVSPSRDLARYEEKVFSVLRQAKDLGADLVLLAEYCSMELAAAFNALGDAGQELDAVTACAPALIALYRRAAAESGLWLQPGTLPMRAAHGIINRAPLIAPDGRLAFQDKSIMTRFEAEQWGVCAGATPSIFATPWGKIGIAICYDAEFPSLVRAQVAAGAFLILVPSCTDSWHGFTRVQISARARAIENQCYVAVAPTVGHAPELASVDENHGAAGIFGPADRGFPADGILAEGPRDAAAVIIADLDPEALAAVRANGAVRNFHDWPGEVPPCLNAIWEEA